MKFTTSFLSILTLLFISIETNAQDSANYKNSVMLEIGGNGLAYSVNYERFLSNKFNLRAGVSFLKIIENQTDKSIIFMSYPISFSYLINLNNQKHYIETGVGTMNLVTSGDLIEYKGVTNYYVNPFLNLGYRYEPSKSRFLYRIGLSPFLGTTSLTNPTEQGFRPLGSEIQVWGYIAIGYMF